MPANIADTLTETTTRAVELDEDQITAIVLEYLANYWGVPETAIQGAIEANDYRGRCEGRFFYTTTKG